MTTSIRDEFITWLATKSGPYEYLDHYNCPLAQFGQFREGNSKIFGSISRYHDRQEYSVRVLDDLDDIGALANSGTFETLYTALTEKSS